MPPTWPTTSFPPWELYALPNHLCSSAEVTPWGSTCLPLSETLDTGREDKTQALSLCVLGDNRNTRHSPHLQR